MRSLITTTVQAARMHSLLSALLLSHVYASEEAKKIHLRRMALLVMACFQLLEEGVGQYADDEPTRSLASYFNTGFEGINLLLAYQNEILVLPRSAMQFIPPDEIGGRRFICEEAGLPDDFDWQLIHFSALKKVVKNEVIRLRALSAELTLHSTMRHAVDASAVILSWVDRLFGYFLTGLNPTHSSNKVADEVSKAIKYRDVQLLTRKE